MSKRIGGRNWVDAMLITQVAYPTQLENASRSLTMPNVLTSIQGSSPDVGRFGRATISMEAGESEEADIKNIR